ncbi:hypothetical protein SUGI_0904750 [Cryptomeria japonica]|nr:hypothetical protein SUGI_0904750 [Cryptomeria japonica]
MEFSVEEGRICALLDESDEGEVLSFCDLPSAELCAEWENSLRDSNVGCSDQEDFDFDIDFSGCSSTAYETCPADDLFHGGRLLPLAQSNAKTLHSKSNSFGEKRLLLNEKLQAWRTDSLDSQSSYWTSSSSNNSRASHRSLNFSASEKSSCRVNSNAPSSKSKCRANRTSCTSPKPAASSGKPPLNWQQFFSLGLLKTPPMKLEDMRLRQREKSVLKPSVLSFDEEGPTLAGKLRKASNFQQKSKSFKENVSGEETPRTRGWNKLSPLSSLNGCKSCTNSVVNSSTTRKRVDGGVSAASRNISSRRLPLYADQNSPYLARASSKLAASNSLEGLIVQDDQAILGGTSKSSKLDFHRLSFRSTTSLCV